MGLLFLLFFGFATPRAVVGLFSPLLIDFLFT